MTARIRREEDKTHIAGFQKLEHGRIVQFCTRCGDMLLDVPLTTSEEEGLGWSPGGLVYEVVDAKGVRRWYSAKPE